MPNLAYDDIQTAVTAVLSGVQGQDDYRVDTFIKMAVNDAISEFVDIIGTRTTSAVELTNVDDEILDVEVTRVYLPADCWMPRQLLIGGYEVEPVASDMYEKLARSTRAERGFIGKSVQREDGVMYIEVFPAIALPSTATVVLTYRISSEDLGRVPARYKNLIIYGAAKHYYTFVVTDNPVVPSRIAKEYQKYLTSCRSAIANTRVSQTRPYESEWENLFQFFVDRNDRDTR